MHDLPTDWTSLCVLVFLLGMRHGFDADHLAAIDGLTRLSARERRGHAHFCGALFSIGHGAVVLAIAAGVGLLRAHWAPPAWLDGFGAWVSIVFLLVLGIANLRAVLSCDAGSVVSLVGFKGPLLTRLLPARSPLGVAAVGALFALSFDTIGQSALFAVTATHFGGVGRALVLGLLFVGGMLAADGLNGWWISRLIARADQVAAVASRVMGVAVSATSLLVAAWGIGRLASPAVDGWGEGRELAFGAIVVLVIGASYAVAMLLARPAVLQRRTA